MLFYFKPENEGHEHDFMSLPMLKNRKARPSNTASTISNILHDVTVTLDGCWLLGSKVELHF